MAGGLRPAAEAHFVGVAHKIPSHRWIPEAAPLGILKGERFSQGDLFIDYPSESVMFRWELAGRRYYRRFYGEPAETEVRSDNNLLNEAIRFGVEIDGATYAAGRTAD